VPEVLKHILCYTRGKLNCVFQKMLWRDGRLLFGVHKGVILSRSDTTQDFSLLFCLVLYFVLVLAAVRCVKGWYNRKT